jgi:hypothetical protein
VAVRVPVNGWPASTPLRSRMCPKMTMESN